jgi:hypothetical protein
MPLKDHPDYHDADIVLRLYEMRREAVMRESRNAVNAKFTPTTFDEALAITKFDHPHNAAFRQASTFWEMAYGMVRHGVVHAEFMMETNGEGLLLYSKIEPWLAEFREKVSPVAFRNAEWVATNTEAGKAVSARFRARQQAAMAAKK